MWKVLRRLRSKLRLCWWIVWQNDHEDDYIKMPLTRTITVTEMLMLRKPITTTTTVIWKKSRNPGSWPCYTGTPPPLVKGHNTAHHDVYKRRVVRTVCSYTVEVNLSPCLLRTLETIERRSTRLPRATTRRLSRCAPTLMSPIEHECHDYELQEVHSHQRWGRGNNQARGVRRGGQTRRLGVNLDCHQVHQLQLKPALFRATNLYKE